MIPEIRIVIPVVKGFGKFTFEMNVMKARMAVVAIPKRRRCKKPITKFLSVYPTVARKGTITAV